MDFFDVRSEVELLILVIRACIGRNLAMLEIYRFVAEFCHRYDAEPVRPDSPYWTFSQWFVVQKDFDVLLRHRKQG